MFDFIFRIEFDNKSESDTFKTNFQTVFEYKKHLLILCSRIINSQRLLCSQKLVFNFRIKFSGKQRLISTQTSFATTNQMRKYLSW